MNPKKYETIGGTQRELVTNSGIYERAAQVASLKEGEKPRLLLSIIDVVYAAGPQGLIRRDIAERLGKEPGSVTHQVLQLITDGQLVTMPARRKSLSGKGIGGAILVDVRHEEKARLLYGK
jgi:hypothetical protein